MVGLLHFLDRHKGFKQLSTIDIHVFKMFATEAGVDR